MSYSSTQAHLLAELDRVDAIIAAYTGDGAESATSDVSAAENRSMRRPEELSLAVPAADRRAVSELTTEIRDNCRSTDDTRLRLRALADTCGLSRRHLDVLLLAMAPELDEGVWRLFDLQRRASAGVTDA